MKKAETSPTPKLSVIMSCYNREQFVEAAIKSILRQTFRDFEFIIIDDGSKDKTPDIIQKYADIDKRIIFIRQPQNQGLTANLNKAFALAKGVFIARMDDDDISLPTRFEKQIAFMDKHPEICACGTSLKNMGQNSLSHIRYFSPELLAFALCFYNPIAHPTVMIRNSFLKQHHLRYSYDFLYAEDYKLWADMVACGGKLANLREELLYYRLYPSAGERKEYVLIQQQNAERIKNSLLHKFYFSAEEQQKICQNFEAFGAGYAYNRKEWKKAKRLFESRNHVFSPKIVKKFFYRPSSHSFLKNCYAAAKTIRFIIKLPLLPYYACKSYKMLTWDIEHDKH